MKHIIQYTLPYEHIVQVGIEADSPEQAIERAQALFDAGELWDDTPAVPLLMDNYEETGDSGDPLEFTCEASLGDNEAWPEVDVSVKTIRAEQAAMKAARLLVQALMDGNGKIEYRLLEQAHEAALQAAGGQRRQSLVETISDEDIEKANQCMLRAAGIYPNIDRAGLVLDIIGAHRLFDLRFDELLEADDENFLHDIVGIYHNFDRRERVMRDCFCPRYANKQ